MKIFNAQVNGPVNPMSAKYTEKDFDSLAWENFQVFGVTVPCSTPFVNQMAGRNSQKELVLDLDCFIELLPDSDYWHASASLEFHGITDLNANFGSSDSGFQNAPSTFLINDVQREVVENQKVHLDRPYYKWAIQLYNPSQTGHLAFGAYGFTLLVANAVLSKPPSWTQNKG